MGQSDGSQALPQWVALVDDDAQIAQTLKLLLSMKGVNASVHSSAESLLAAVSVEQGRLMMSVEGGARAELASAVLDLNLPGMNGMDLLLRLRAMRADLKLVVITAALDELLQTRGEDLQGVTCLSKPFQLDDLEAALFGR